MFIDSGTSRWLLVTGIRLHVPGIISMQQNFGLLNPRQRRHQRTVKMASRTVPAAVILTMNYTMTSNW